MSKLDKVCAVLRLLILLVYGLIGLTIIVVCFLA